MSCAATRERVEVGRVGMVRGANAPAPRRLPRVPNRFGIFCCRLQDTLSEKKKERKKKNLHTTVPFSTFCWAAPRRHGQEHKPLAISPQTLTVAPSSGTVRSVAAAGRRRTESSSGCGEGAGSSQVFRRVKYLEVRWLSVLFLKVTARVLGLFL